jgi:uncharacterized membrane protein
MKTNWRVELPLLLLMAAMFAGAIVAWPTAPARIPVHWNVDGTVDGYGGKVEGLLGIPLLALAIYLLMRFLPRIDPDRANYARFGGAYTALRAGIVGGVSGVRLDLARLSRSSLTPLALTKKALRG